MLNTTLYTYQDIDAFCKCEGLITDVFIAEINLKRKNRLKGLYTTIIAAFK